MLCFYKIPRLLFVIIILFSFFCSNSAYIYNEDDYYHQNYKDNDFTLLTTIEANHKTCWQNRDSNKIVKKRDSDHQTRPPDTVINLNSNEDHTLDTRNDIDSNIIPNDLTNADFIHNEEKTQKKESQFQVYNNHIDNYKPTRRFNNYNDYQDRASFVTDLKEVERDGVLERFSSSFELTPQFIKPSRNRHEYNYTYNPIRTEEYGNFEGNYLKKTSENIETTDLKLSRSTELIYHKHSREGKGMENIQPTLEQKKGSPSNYFPTPIQNRESIRKIRTKGYDRKNRRLGNSRRAQSINFNNEEYHIYETKKTTSDYDTEEENSQNTNPMKNLNNKEINTNIQTTKLNINLNLKETLKIGSSVTEKHEFRDFKTKYSPEPTRSAENIRKNMPTRSVFRTIKSLEPSKISINFDDGDYHIFETERSKITSDYDTEEDNYDNMTPKKYLENNHILNTDNQESYRITSKIIINEHEKKKLGALKPTRSTEYNTYMPTKIASKLLKTTKSIEPSKISINSDEGDYHTFETESSRTTSDYDTEDENYKITSLTKNTSIVAAKENDQLGVFQTTKSIEASKISINFDGGDYHTFETERSRTTSDYDTEDENYKITSLTKNTSIVAAKENDQLGVFQTVSSPKPSRSAVDKRKNVPTRSMIRTIKPFDPSKISIDFDSGEYHVFETERSRTSSEYNTEEENYDNNAPTKYLENENTSQNHERTYQTKKKSFAKENNIMATIVQFRSFQTHQSNKPSRSTYNNIKYIPTKSVFETTKALDFMKETIHFETEQYNYVTEKITENYDTEEKIYPTETPSMNYILSQSTDNYENYDDSTNIKTSIRFFDTEAVKSKPTRRKNVYKNTDIMRHKIPSDISVTKNVFNSKKLKTLANNQHYNNIYVITIPDFKTDPEFTQEYIDFNSSTATIQSDFENTTKKKKFLKIIFNDTNENIEIERKDNTERKSKTNKKANSKEGTETSTFDVMGFLNKFTKKSQYEIVSKITTEEYEDYRSTTSFYDHTKALKKMNVLRGKGIMNKFKIFYEPKLSDYNPFSTLPRPIAAISKSTTINQKTAKKDIYVDYTLEHETSTPVEEDVAMTLPLCRPRTTTASTTTTEEPGTPATATTTKPRPPKFDLAALMEIIGNLTFDYETNLTSQINESLQRFSIPTCKTPGTYSTRSETTPTSTTAPPFYRGPSTGFGIIVSKCFVCGLEESGIPMAAHCADAFAGDFLPLVPVDPTSRRHISKFRRYCRFKDIPGYYQNSSDPRSLYGRWTGGCSVRWIDLSGIYTQRTCRNRHKATLGNSFASKRMAKLEMALSGVENGCIASPSASLVPLSRGISLFARFHACVCAGNWCNEANVIDVPIALIFGTMLLHFFHLTVDVA